MRVRYLRWKDGTASWEAELVVSKAVQEVGWHPAYAHFGMCKVKFESRCVLQRIKGEAFRGTKLRTFEAPPSLREISPAAFTNCDSL